MPSTPGVWRGLLTPPNTGGGGPRAGPPRGPPGGLRHRAREAACAPADGGGGAVRGRRLAVPAPPPLVHERRRCGDVFDGRGALLRFGAGFRPRPRRRIKVDDPRLSEGDEVDAFEAVAGEAAAAEI